MKYSIKNVKNDIQHKNIEISIKHIIEQNKMMRIYFFFYLTNIMTILYILSILMKYNDYIIYIVYIIYRQRLF